MIYGVIPAAGLGQRLQPLAFSKELSLVGEKAIIEHLLERFVIAGIEKIFVVINPDKLDIPRYLSSKSIYKDNLIFLVKNSPSLPDSVLYPANFIAPRDILYFGLPDTIWYPKNAFLKLKRFKSDNLVLGLFSTENPEKFDAVSCHENGVITKIEVKVEQPASNWVWGIGKVRSSVAKRLLASLPEGDESQRIFGKAMNHYVKANRSYAVKFNHSDYLDIGRKEDYKKAEEFLQKHETSG